MLAELLEGMNEKKHAGFSNEASSPMLIKIVITEKGSRPALYYKANAQANVQQLLF